MQYSWMVQKYLYKSQEILTFVSFNEYYHSVISNGLSRFNKWREQILIIKALLS